MMKKMKGLLAVMLSLCMVIAAFCMTASEAEASGATTYSLRVEDDEWRYQPNYPWDDSVQDRELYYMQQDFKDGDKIVILESSKKLELQISKNIGNLTLQRAGDVIVTAPYIEECHVLGGCKTAINADINKAYVYDTTTCNFNKNVQYLEIMVEKEGATLSATVGASGKVAHAYAHEGSHVVFDIYDVKENTFSVIGGAFNTAESNFSRTPSDSTVVSAPSKPEAATPAKPAAPSPEDELDDVPKTGDIASYYWMFALAVVCLLAGLGFQFSAGKEKSNK